MTDLEQELHRRYLDQIDGPWDDEDLRLDFGEQALPYFVAALNAERSAERPARLIRAIWQFRVPAALPTLAAALDDPAPDAWKEALDGIVTLGGDEARKILAAARTKSAAAPDEKEKSEWINEALIQTVDGVWAKPD